MYNTEQKERYISIQEENGIKGFRNNITKVFQHAETLENELNKDCSQFTFSEIKDMFSSMFTASWTGLMNYNSLLNNYTYWCMQENLIPDNQNHYAEIDRMDLYNCLNFAARDKRISSKNELLKKIHDIPNACDQFLVLAIFEGIGEQSDFAADFYQLTIENFKGNKVKLTNRTITVSDRLIELAKESANEFNKYSIDGEKLARGFRQTDASIVKDSANSINSDLAHNSRKIATRLINLKKTFGTKFSYGALRDSGKIHFLNQLAIVDKSDDIYATYLNHKNEYDVRFGVPQPDQLKTFIFKYSKFFTTEKALA